MLKRNIILALRTFRTFKRNTILNVLGLGVATAAFLLVMQYVTYERSYESFHSKAERIKRVTVDMYNGAEMIGTDCETYPPLAPALKKQFPEIEDFVRIQDVSPAEVKYNDRIFALEKLFAADPSVFSVFDFPLIQGNAATALDKPMQVVLTKKMADRLFGHENPLGKTISFNTIPATVSGVMKDVPPLKEENFTSTLANHISRVDFQLSEHRDPLTYGADPLHIRERFSLLLF
ncbi:MAG: hypothetical protein EOO02_09280 [Chitinophagaceae bacterium]|nr:MAG: hypothetical protein EOO02_09280 [Chitinophagaceae bacterium]